MRSIMFRSGAVLLAFTPLLAQVDTGTLAGTVCDSSGGVVPQARVSVRSDATAVDLALESNSADLYVSPPLRAGEYTITVTAPGFEPPAKRVQLDLSQRAVVDFDLKIGAVTQNVVVVDATPMLQTESTTLSNLRTEKSIKDLPLNGHNGLGILIFPSVDSIAEFRIESSVSDAQSGRGGGGTVNLVYKSGSKDFHGNVFEFFRNAKLDAKNFFDRAADLIPPFKQNQFGGTLGGPLFPWVADKRTFFFVSYEGLRVRQAQTLISSVPTAAFREGDFSAAPQRIFDPLTQVQVGPRPVHKNSL